MHTHVPGTIKMSTAANIHVDLHVVRHTSRRGMIIVMNQIVSYLSISPVFVAHRGDRHGYSYTLLLGLLDLHVQVDVVHVPFSPAGLSKLLPSYSVPSFYMYFVHIFRIFCLRSVHELLALFRFNLSKHVYASTTLPVRVHCNM